MYALSEVCQAVTQRLSVCLSAGHVRLRRGGGEERLV